MILIMTKVQELKVKLINDRTHYILARLKGRHSSLHEWVSYFRWNMGANNHKWILKACLFNQHAGKNGGVLVLVEWESQTVVFGVLSWIYLLIEFEKDFLLKFLKEIEILWVFHHGCADEGINLHVFTW